MDNHSFTTSSNNLTGDHRNELNESPINNEGSRIGWAFISQYYNYLNKEPQKLHCFYTKISTFVHSTEGVEAIPCYGQRQIHEKILSLDFVDCKVYISSVDCQSSAQGGIIVQVLGELSNKGQKWRKFVQTFFLAEQNAGYFVLNDIRRFIKEEDDEEEEEEEVVVPTPNHIPTNFQIPEKVVEKVVVEEKPVEVIKIEEPILITPIEPVVVVEIPVTVEPIIIEKPVIAPIVEAVILPPVIAPSPPAVVSTPPKAQNAPKSAPKPKSIPKPKEEKPEVEKVVEKPIVLAPTPVEVVEPVLPVASTSTSAPAPTPISNPVAIPPPTPSSAPAATPVAKSWAALASQTTNKWTGSAISSKPGISSTVPSNPLPNASTTTPTPHSSNSSHFTPTKAIPFPPAIASLTSPACFIKGIHENLSPATEKTLKDQLTKSYGPLKDFEILRAKNCGFCEFESLMGAKKAILGSLKREEGGAGGITIGNESFFVVTKVSSGGGGGKRNTGPRNNSGNGQGGQNGGNQGGNNRKDESKDGNKEGNKKNGNRTQSGINGNANGNGGNAGGSSNGGNRTKKVVTPAPAK